MTQRIPVSYTLSNWEAPIRHFEDGDLEIDNNGAEWSLRGVAVGRKNRPFFGSDDGGRAAAILTSFITVRKRLQINPVKDGSRNLIPRTEWDCSSEPCAKHILHIRKANLEDDATAKGKRLGW